MDNVYWNEKSYKDFLGELYELSDEKYRDFQQGLLASKLPLIGIRTPVLRKKANEIGKADGKGFLACCGKDTYEERLLYGLVAAELKISYEEFSVYFEEYIYNFIENWALCDVFCSSLKRRAAKNEEELFEHSKKFLTSQNPWAVRAGLIILLDHYLKEPYFDRVLRLTEEVTSERYYIEMAQAWLLATAWAKEPQRVREFMGKAVFSSSVELKFIQKACDSFRISDEDKAFLRRRREEMRRKG